MNKEGIKGFKLILTLKENRFIQDMNSEYVVIDTYDNSGIKVSKLIERDELFKELR